MLVSITGISEGAGGMFGKMQGFVVDDEGEQQSEVASACLIASFSKDLWGLATTETSKKFPEDFYQMTSFS